MNLLRRITVIVLIIAGTLFLIAVGLSFTTLPFHAWYRLGNRSAGIHRPPDAIVLMGGGGMPGTSGLIRCWYTAQAALHFERAMVIIALPGDTADSNSSVREMKKELILRGVAGERIRFEAMGTNTRSQALKVHEMAEKQKSPPSLLIVTSPEHLHRAVLSFRKAGFNRVDGLAAWERTIESDLEFSGKKLGGRGLIPDIGTNLSVRYEFWTQMNYELLVLREWSALLYYRLKGWI